jgi:hypothetical protein
VRVTGLIEAASGLAATIVPHGPPTVEVRRSFVFAVLTPGVNERAV